MPIFGITASSNMSTKLTNFSSIASTTLGSATSTVTFSSIPTNFTHLQLRIYARGSTNDALYMRVNGDTTSTYTRHAMRGSGSSVSSFGNASVDSSYIGQIRATGTNSFGAYIIDILDYKNTNKNKTIKIKAGYNNNSDGYIELNSSCYLATSAISSLSFFVGSTGGIETDSRFSLYGVI
jgi:hypothetical protein